MDEHTEQMRELPGEVRQINNKMRARAEDLRYRRLWHGSNEPKGPEEAATEIVVRNLQYQGQLLPLPEVVNSIFAEIGGLHKIHNRDVARLEGHIRLLRQALKIDDADDAEELKDKRREHTAQTTLLDIYGIDPNFTGGLSVTEFLRRQRGGEPEDEPLPTFEDVRGILKEEPDEPHFDKNGWCHDLEKAPRGKYMLIARRGVPLVVPGYRDEDGQWLEADTGPHLRQVIAWRPLPDPPEEES